MKKILVSLYLYWLRMRGFKMVHFFHIRKAAGTAIRAAVSSRNNLVGSMVVSNGYVFLMHGHDFTIKDLKPGEYFFFATREPIGRFVSGFYSRLRQGQPKNFNPWTPGEVVAFDIFKTPNELAEAMTSEDDQLRKNAMTAMQEIRHVNSSYWDWFVDEKTFEENRNRILYILNQKGLNDDFRNFQLMYNIDLGELPNDPVKAHRKPDNHKDELSELAKSNLKKWYAREYAFLDMIRDFKPSLLNNKVV